MSAHLLERKLAYRLIVGAVVALLTAACWWVWMAWDHGYQTDPVTGATSGPYQAWQVIGCVACLVALSVGATGRLAAWLVVSIMSLAFTSAWSWTAASADSTGLWGVGAILVFLGMLGGTSLIVGLTVVVRRSKSGDAQGEKG